MKAILIDVKNQKIKEVEHDDTLKSIYEHVDCRTFDVISIDNNNYVYVDDEGLFAKEQAYWKFDYCNDQPHIKLVNKGLVLGCNDEGDSIAPESTVDYIKSRIIWRW